MENTRNSSLVGRLAVLWLLSFQPLYAQESTPDDFNLGANSPSATAILTVNTATLGLDFKPGITADTLTSVSCLAIQPNGKILLAGKLEYDGRLIRVNPADGQLDLDFSLGGSAYVNSVLVQDDGRILVGGYFTHWEDQPRNGLVRLTEEGSLDNSFDPMLPLYPSPRAWQPDGTILVGQGDHIVRLRPDGSQDTNFNPVFDGQMYALAVQSDGRILVGGDFTFLNGQPRAFLGRLQADGALDGQFNPELDGRVTTLVWLPDRKFLIGGSFSVIGGQPRRGLARLQADGTLDPEFNLDAEVQVTAVAAQADGKIVIGGQWATPGGAPGNRIGRLNPDGTLDRNFNLVADKAVKTLAILPDGQILAGGLFSQLDGQSRPAVARLNNTDPATQSLAVDGSTITWRRGGASPEISRASFEISTNRTDWRPLGEGSRVPPIGHTGGWQITGVSLSPESSLRARGPVCGDQNSSGWFVESYYGKPVFIAQPSDQTHNASATVNLLVVAGGSDPLAFQWYRNGLPLDDAGNISGSTTTTLRLSNVLRDDINGYFVVVSNAFGSLTSQVARLTVIDPAIIAQPESQNREPGQDAIFNVIAQGSGTLNYQWWKDGIALDNYREPSLSLTNLQAGDAGQYRVVVTSPYGSITSAVAHLTVNLITLDSEFARIAGYYPYQFALAPQSDGKILVAGTTDVLRWNANGTPDADFRPAIGSWIKSLALQADGKFLAGGHFGTPLARWNPAGSPDRSFHPQTNLFVFALALQPDGKILVGGIFSAVSGQPHQNLARLNADGTLDDAFNPAIDKVGHFTGRVYSLAVQTDGKILVGGYFTNVCGQPRNYLARLNIDGTLDPGFNPDISGPSGNLDLLFYPAPAVLSLVQQPDGKILVGGMFAKLGGQPRVCIGRINPDGTLDASFDPEPDGPVYSLVLQTDEKILVGGWFSTLGALPRGCIGRLNADGSPDETFNPGWNGTASALAMQADGKIIALGEFYNPNDKDSKWSSVRFNNSTPATQSLLFDGSTIKWLRGGASPEVWRTSAEYSLDGAIWTNLGAGARITDGWQWTGVFIPTNAIIRACGFITDGGKSSWFVESGWPEFPRLAPVILSGTSNFGMVSNRFGFSLRAVNRQVLVIESSSDLTHWTPIATNAVNGSGPIGFAEDIGTGVAARFYRARLAP